MEDRDNNIKEINRRINTQVDMDYEHTDEQISIIQLIEIIAELQERISLLEAK